MTKKRLLIYLGSTFALTWAYCLLFKLIDNFSLKVPHPEFLSSANRYLKLRYGAGVYVSKGALNQWVYLFKQKQKQILSQLKMKGGREVK